MTRSAITWVHDGTEPDRARLRFNNGPGERLINEVARYAGVSIPRLDGRLADVAPADGLILWTAYGQDVSSPFWAATDEASRDLDERFARRMILIDVSTSRLFDGLEALQLAAAIASSDHTRWLRTGPLAEQGLYGRREIAAAIGAKPDETQGSNNYCYMTSDRHEGLPHLLADYLAVFHERYEESLKP